MAGIGFTLRKLARQDNLAGVMQGYALSSVISMGPWLFIILTLTAFNMVGGWVGSPMVITEFRAILIYNFAFSLVLSGPVLVIVTRYLADRIFEKNVSDAQAVFFAALAILWASQLVVLVPFYGFYLKAEAVVRVLAALGFLLISGLWLALAFITATKNYKMVTVAFVIGLLVGLVLSVSLLPDYQVKGVLLGFNIGLAIVFFIMVATIMTSFPFHFGRPFAFLAYFSSHWELALIGLVYNLAIWIDKFIMWGAPESFALDNGLVTNPIYDSATFLAYLTVVPAMSRFVMDVETAFFEHYRNFYQEISDHAGFAKITRNLHAMRTLLLEKLRGLTVLQGGMAIAAVLVAPFVFETFRVNFMQMGVFRLAVLGAFFHMVLLFACIILSYFDLRRLVLLISLVFLVLNGVFTACSIGFGFQSYGYGYFLACLISAGVAGVLGSIAVGRLPYLAFVSVNKSTR